MWIIVVPIGLGTGFLKWHGFHVIGELLTAQAFLSAFGEVQLCPFVLSDHIFQDLFHGSHYRRIVFPSNFNEWNTPAVLFKMETW